MLRTSAFAVLALMITASVSQAVVIVDIIADPALSATWGGGDIYRVDMFNGETTDITSIALDFTPLPTTIGLNSSIQNAPPNPAFGTFVSFGDSFFVIPDGLTAVTAGIIDGENLGLAGGITIQGGGPIVEVGVTQTVMILGIKNGNPDPATILGLVPGQVIPDNTVVTVESANIGTGLKLPVIYAPEPASLALLGLGGLALIRRR